MTTITTRSGKGSALTHDQADANFNNLNDDKVEKVTSTDNAFARYDGTSGAVQNGQTTEDDSGNVSVSGNVSPTGTVDGRDVATDGTKLDGIESGATADQTDAEIETAYNNQVAAASQAEMEAGTETEIRRVSPARVKQAIDALSSAPTVLQKSGDYTVTAADVDAPSCNVVVDISAASVEIDAPAVADLNGKILRVSVGTEEASATGTNRLNVRRSDGTTLVWIGVRTSDEVVLTSDGSVYIVLSHHEDILIQVFGDADESVAAGTSEKMTSMIEKLDKGHFWTAGVADGITALPLDAYMDLHWRLLSDDAKNIAEAKAGPSGSLVYLFDASTVAAASFSSANIDMLSLIGIELDANDLVELWSLNGDTDSGAENVLGDAAGDESQATIRLRWRI